MKFQDLKMVEIRNGHFQATEQFGQYQLSVVLLPGATKYEVAIFDDDMFVQLPGIHPSYGDDWGDDVIPGLMPEDVSGIMNKLETLQGPPK
tara:strand:- start:975 stop:1247 length:273 start_codon:yes stop_codon:yes gene_type:complete